MSTPKISDRPKEDQDTGRSQCTSTVVLPKTSSPVMDIATVEIGKVKIENAHTDFHISLSELFEAENVKEYCECHGKYEISYTDEISTYLKTTTQTPLCTGHTYNQLLESLSENSSKASIGSPPVFLMTFAVGIVLLLWYNNRWSSMTSTPTAPANQPTHALQPRTKEEHKGVIHFTPVSGSRILNRIKRQACRALPNERLKIVFGIENAFTTTDIHIHDAFRDAAVQKMQDAIRLDKSKPQVRDGDWADLRDLARASVGQMLFPETKGVRLVDLIRVVTLAVSFRFLFNTPEEKLLAQETREQLILMGQKINDLWIASKDSTQPLTPWASSTNQDMHDALRDICRSSDSQEEVWDPLIPTQNPLNFLLPAYETMWRAVLFGVLEVYFHKPVLETSTWHVILQSYVANPSRGEFKLTSLSEELSTSPESRGLSTSDIVKETLRLYPPTKHVYRRFPSTSSSSPSAAATSDTIASIEGLHHDTSADGFGPDALIFRPERWVDMRNDFLAKTNDSELKTSDKQTQSSDEQAQNNERQIQTNDSEVQTSTSTSASAIQTTKTQAQTKSKTYPKPTSTDSDIKKLEESKGFIPFAMICPAGKRETQGFGMKMIGLLVGVLGEGIIGDRDLSVLQWKLVDKKEQEYILASPLSGDRKAFEGVMMMRKKDG